MPFITISCQAGSLGDEIAGFLSQKLNIELITHNFVMSEWMPEIANKYELHMLEESPKFYLNPSSTGMTFAEFIESRLKEIVESQPVIILGLGSQVIFNNYPGAANIRIIASNEVRVSRLMQRYRMEKEEAEKFLELSDRKHRRYVFSIYGKDWSDQELYHMTLNTSSMNTEDAAVILSHFFEICKNSNTGILPAANVDMPLTHHETEQHKFVHPSEEEFSKILDMYNIQWEYEPRTFPIEWDAEGNVIRAFTPDFYLPRFDTYIELTTMDQKYVTEKNKKVRRMKELYPGININIVFNRDYHTLLKRFGFRKGEGSR